MRVMITASLLVIVSVTGFALSEDKKSSPKPDLSGTWVLDEPQSTTGASKSDKVTDYTLTIAHREPEIRMSKQYKQGGREVVDEVVYYTDGRPEFSSLRGARDPEPITRWRGRKLIRRSVKEAKGPLRLKAETVEEWVLSNDGKTLTRTVLNSGTGFTTKSKYVFTRVS